MVKNHILAENFSQKMWSHVVSDHTRPHILPLEGKSVAMWSETTFQSNPLPPQPALPLPLSPCGPLWPRDHIRPHFLALEGKSLAMWSETTFLSNPLPLNLLLPPQHVVLDHILPLPRDNVVPCGLQTTFWGLTPLAMYRYQKVVRFPPQIIRFFVNNV